MLRPLMDIFSSGRGTEAMWDVIVIVLGAVMVVFLALPIHEWAHAFSAHKLGDDTAKWSGRMTINPLKHLDIFGTVMILLCGVGYAKPVPINPYNFRKPKVGMALSALTGPLSNLFLAIVSVGLYRIFYAIAEGQANAALMAGDIASLNNWVQIDEYVWTVLIGLFASINLSLAVFNLLPIPPLDGSRILALIVPDRIMDMINRYEMYISIALMALLLSGALDAPLTWLRHSFGFLVCGMFGMPNVF